LRAIEQGLPIARAANSGISAIVDPYGRILKSLPLGDRGILDSGLPRALPATFYSRWGDVILVASICVAIALVVALSFAARRNDNRV
jgi:apolipoprotein N-acyltransferase